MNTSQTQPKRRLASFSFISKKPSPFAMLLLPTMVVLLGFTIYPTIYGVWLSFQELVGGSFTNIQFAGLDNYSSLFRRAEFWDSLRVTLIFAFSSTIGALILGILLAFLLNRPFFGRGLYLSLLILPIVATPVVSGLMWKYMLNPDSGVINYFLGLVGLPQPIWLAKSRTALIAVIGVEIWQWTAFVALLMLAGLQTIPKEQYEAATVDGANRLQTAFRIILPQLSPLIISIVLLRLIDSFKSFDTIFVMTAGGPGRATQVFNILAYYTGFRYFEFGRAAALTFVGLIVLIIVFQLIMKAAKASNLTEE